MNKFLTINDMEKICEEINEKHIPDDSRFMQAINDQFAEFGDANRDQFVSSAFKRMLSVLDKEIKKIEKKVNINATCEKGCSHCCYFPIILTKMEAKLIVQYIQQLPKLKKEELVTHLEQYYRNEDLTMVYNIDFKTDQQYKGKYITKQVPCPLLDKQTNSCLAYEVRPIACRTHYNYCNPQVCSTEPIPDEVFSYEFLYEYYIYALVNTVQDVILDSKDDPINLPTDVYEADYLPRLLEELL